MSAVMLTQSQPSLGCDPALSSLVFSISQSSAACQHIFKLILLKVDTFLKSSNGHLELVSFNKINGICCHKKVPSKNKRESFNSNTSICTKNMQTLLPSSSFSKHLSENGTCLYKLVPVYSTCTCAKAFIAALFILDVTWKQSK